MRRPSQIIFLILLVAGSVSAIAATGSIAKVLPQLLDSNGRHSLSPSLFDRDAYQAQLRQHPEKCFGVRFDVLWRGRSATNETAVLKLELRGTAKGNLPSQHTLEKPVRITGTGHWAEFKLDGENYKTFGEVTAWRVSLWSGDQLLGEQKSFLW